MGKKKKGGGAEKTAAKTDKKMANKLKKNLALTGEEDIEKIVAEIEREERKKVEVTEKVTSSPPTCRAFFSLVAHPEKDELFLFGGEYHNGKETEVFNDLFVYKTGKEEWRLVRSGCGPGPRSGHAAVSVPLGRGQMWMFGGEFTTKSESQFYHYNDLWLLSMDTRTWQKITATGGPCSRSGHRMVAIKKQLILFGGYHDNLQDYKYFNDVYIFNMETTTWHKITPAGNCPSARSGCQMVATGDGKVLIWGGYSKVKVKKDIDTGVVHHDMFLLAPEKGDESGLKWRWRSLKPGGAKPEPLSGVAVASHPGVDRAYVFGGAQDTETETSEDLTTTFYNQLHSLDLANYVWTQVTLSGKKEGVKSRRRKRVKESGEDEAGEGEEDDDEMEVEEEEQKTEDPSTSAPSQSAEVVDDGVFRLEVGGAAAPVVEDSGSGVAKSGRTPQHPHPRINAGLVVKSNKLYLYGGIYETPQVVHTLTDFHVLDVQKLDEWKTLVPCDLSQQEWLESSSESEDSGSEQEDDSDSQHSHDSQT